MPVDTGDPHSGREATGWQQFRAIVRKNWLLRLRGG